MLWTLILSMTMFTGSGSSVHSVTVPNLSSKEVCQKAGTEHIQKYETIWWNRNIKNVAAIYTCVEQGNILK